MSHSHPVSAIPIRLILICQLISILICQLIMRLIMKSVAVADTVIVLLAGGDKRTQARDINTALRLARYLQEGP
jgi:hypothetical protein